MEAWPEGEPGDRARGVAAALEVRGVEEEGPWRPGSPGEPVLGPVGQWGPTAYPLQLLWLSRHCPERLREPRAEVMQSSLNEEG